ISVPPFTKFHRGLFITLRASTRISSCLLSAKRIRFTRFTSKLACAGASIHWRPIVPTTPGAGLARIVLPLASCRAGGGGGLRRVCNVVTLLPAGSATCLRPGKYVAPFDVYVSFPLLFGKSPRIFGVFGLSLIHI